MRTHTLMDAKSSACRNPNPKSSPSPPMATAVTIRRFLRALSRVHRTASRSSRLDRGRRIQRAAYAAMARSAGPRWAWSRALLRKLRRGDRPRRQMLAEAARRARQSRDSVVGGAGSASEGGLRRVVPGGAAMDYCSLLEETADYIKSLRMQVTLMQTIVDSAAPCGRPSASSVRH